MVQFMETAPEMTAESLPDDYHNLVEHVPAPGVLIDMQVAWDYPGPPIEELQLGERPRLKTLRGLLKENPAKYLEQLLTLEKQHLQVVEKAAEAWANAQHKEKPKEEEEEGPDQGTVKAGELIEELLQGFEAAK